MAHNINYLQYVYTSRGHLATAMVAKTHVQKSVKSAQTDSDFSCKDVNY